MLSRLKRLFFVSTKFEAFLVIYALALGGAERGIHYMEQYPGTGGKLLMLACVSTVFLAGGMILEAVEQRQAR